MEEILIGSTDRSILVYIADPASTDGSGKTGLAHTDMTVSATRMETDNDCVVTDYTSSLNALTNLTDAHNDWGWKEVSSTLAPGLYRLDIADAVFASGAWYAVVSVAITTSLASVVPKGFKLVNFDMYGQSAADLKDFADDGYDPSTNLCAADMVRVSGDETAADNLETMLDGTGGATLSLGNLTIVSSSGPAISAEAQGANDHAVLFTGQGAGAGLKILSGSGTGNTSCAALIVQSQMTTANAVYCIGTGAGDGMHVVSGGTGHGLHAVGGATSGSGAKFEGATLGHGLELAGAGSGKFDLASTTAGVSCTSLDVSGATTLSTLAVSGGTTLTNSGTGKALQITTTGSGSPIHIESLAGTCPSLIYLNTGGGTAEGIRFVIDSGNDILHTGSVVYTSITASGAVTMTNASNDIVGIDVAKLSGDATAADNAEAFFDGTGYAGTNNVIPTVTNVTTKTGYKLASDGLDLVLVDTKTLPAALQYIAAGVAGKVSGAGTSTEVFVGIDGSSTRLTVTADASGNRTAVTYS